MSGRKEKNSSVSEDEKVEPVRVSKWDGTAVKNALDDAVKDVLISRCGYDEDHSLMDGRLWICGVAVAVAMFALAWDYLHPFPQSRNVLIGCVGTYFFLMSVLTLYTTYKEKGIFVVAIQRDPAGLDPDCYWEASSHMKKFDDIYELSLVYTDGKKKARDASFTASCGQFFDENGLLCLDLLDNAVMKLHKSLTADKKDS